MSDRDVPHVPASGLGPDVSPSTGLDSEIRGFMGRVMTGYEQAHRRMADLCETMAARAESAERLANQALEARMKLAIELEDAISQRHARELAADGARQKQEAFAQVASDVRAIGPLVLKKLLGIPITGDDSHGLTDFLKAIGEDRVEKLFTEGTLTLSLPERQLLASTLTSLAQDEAKKKAAQNGKAS